MLCCRGDDEGVRSWMVSLVERGGEEGEGGGGGEEEGGGGGREAGLAELAACLVGLARRDERCVLNPADILKSSFCLILRIGISFFKFILLLHMKFVATIKSRCWLIFGP